MSHDIEKAKKILENSNIEEVMRQVDEMNNKADLQKKMIIWEIIANLLAYKTQNWK